MQNRDFKGVWIPKEIWLDNELTWMEKLFIVEINSLDNEHGCFASNSYLGDFFNLSNGRVSQIIKSLIEKQYLSAEYEMEGKEVKRRILRILNTGIKNSKQEGIKNPKTGIKNSKGGYLENDKDNNTVFNNTINKNKYDEIEDFFNTLWNLYPNKKGKTKVSKESRKKINKIGLEHMQRAILRYRKEVENVEMKYIKHGSSFFNSGYIDYLDENYTGTNDIYNKFDGDDEVIENILPFVQIKRGQYRQLILNYSQEITDNIIEHLNTIKEKGEIIGTSDFEWIERQLKKVAS